MDHDEAYVSLMVKLGLYTPPNIVEARSRMFTALTTTECRGNMPQTYTLIFGHANVARIVVDPLMDTNCYLECVAGTFPECVSILREYWEHGTHTLTVMRIMSCMLGYNLALLYQGAYEKVVWNHGWPTLWLVASERLGIQTLKHLQAVEVINVTEE